MAACASVIEPLVKFSEFCLRRSAFPSSHSSFQGFASESFEKETLSIIFKNLPFLKSDSVLAERELADISGSHSSGTLQKISRLQKLLFKANIQNKDYPISLSLNEEIGNLIYELKITGDIQVLLTLIHLIAENNYCYSKSHMTDVLKEIQKLHPDLAKFVLDSLIITPEGIDRLLSVISKSFGWSNVGVYCANIEDLSEIIEYVNVTPGIYGMIFYFPKVWHVAPVFIRNDGINISVLITDSVGDLGGNFCFEAFFSLQKKYLNLKIYSFLLPRQRDEFSCSVFSLLDLINLVESAIHKKDIFKWLEQFNSDKIEEGCERVRMIKILPPDMLCSSQFLSHSKSYTKPPSDLSKAGSVFNEYLLQVKNMQKIIRANICLDGRGKPRNKYIERKHYKLIELLLSELLKSSA